MRRPHRSSEWWSYESNYIASIVTPGSRFNYDWRCVWVYVDMQCRHCIHDIGSDHPASMRIKAFLDSIADQAT